ncbi:ECF transporter S component [Tepidiforma flava]|uniref:ECF transporter S component n=1 Tax=Tepidiforma flava TaxID=3004094 RepID=A0ABY7MA87_9CHLR|nr:ECF transporter S component [Tepidiforma flava]WBL37365.1 ECF transporter S component [Tepidiforma flava]
MAASPALPRAAARPAAARFDPGALVFVLLNVLGLFAYLHPFFAPGVVDEGSAWFAHQADAPVVFAGIAALCLVLVVADLASGGLDSKRLAVLGVLSALAAVLRTITLPAGANLYFFLVILGAFTFGARLGFLLGALSFFLSAVVTGGFGPWLPFQMFAAGWMGASAGLLGRFADARELGPRRRLALVIAFGSAWGLIYGAITNLWAWPWIVAGPDISYQAGAGPLETLRRYWNYYLLTSLGWDLFRTICNAVVLGAVGGPILRALLRFRERFSFERGAPAG